MTDQKRKEYPDFEGFAPEGWEVVEEQDTPEFLTEARKQARLNISGRGGKRPGAGRPAGSKKDATKQIRLPADIVKWLQTDIETKMKKIRNLMSES